VLDLWGRTLTAVETGDLSLVDREIDWVTKYQLIERYRAKHDLPLSSPRIAQLDLAYHDVNRSAASTTCSSARRRRARRPPTSPVFEAKSLPPQTTARGCAASSSRAPGEAARLHRRLGAPQAERPGQRTVLCKDPFRSVDDRVEKLIASM
jgi:proteasome accessory factor A